MKNCTLTSFVALGIRSEGTGEPKFGIAFSTMLQHTGLLWLSIC